MDINISIENNKDNLIDVNIERQFTPSGKLSTKLVGYIKHKGLNVERKLVESDLTILQRRLNDQGMKWVKEWDVLEKNKEILNTIEKIKNILDDGVERETVVDWEKVKDHSLFSKIKPTFADIEPKLEETQPKPHFFDKIIKSHYEKVLAQQKTNFVKSLKLWKEKKKTFENDLETWKKDMSDFETIQKKLNKDVDDLNADYNKVKSPAIELYSQILLKQSNYPINFAKKIAVEYKPAQKLLVVEYFLPSVGDLPKIKEIKYLKSTDEAKDAYFSVNELKQLYDNTLYQIVLRTIYELYKGDVVKAIESIVFNGWVNDLNKATGKQQNVCILSLMVNKTEFMEVNFTKVDAKACFKQFKGVSASELSGLAAVPPILRISREDKRFIEERIVGQNLDNSANIAAMDWQDFEQLIREIFEKEYSTIGGEVKVTQSSRDRGVDAVAFDPDPVRGGKIIIQAKRYTNTVDIESVRALYGVMQDEGAMKGILITTSDFGPDAYSFVKNKPITLLNGGNLLSMLHSHGYEGKIDIKEAKKLLGEYISNK